MIGVVFRNLRIPSFMLAEHLKKINILPSSNAMSLSSPNPMEPSPSHRVRLLNRKKLVFKLNSASTGSLTWKVGQWLKICVFKTAMMSMQLTCWNLMSISKLSGSLGLHTTGNEYD